MFVELDPSSLVLLALPPLPTRLRKKEPSSPMGHSLITYVGIHYPWVHLADLHFPAL